MELEKILRLLDQFGVSVTLLVITLIGVYYIAKKVLEFQTGVFNKMQERIDELEEALEDLRNRFEDYLLKDNREIKQALVENQQIQREMTTTLDNTIEIIRLNTEAYDKSRIVFEKVITFISETTKIIQRWTQT